eukprot:CAMPEP_0172738842 /NCGR_PEP_ID=MMETSP1074-20121228/121127_1 /TAXON_ID=2916 /ORGANISM="Ceratium fusus, Strain PA161109" /LENGTH=55 /DNA_ID=CAMNT_0013568561 /DNA_START=9 /DNA_END=173 /DNA_ORIENTATION=-
MKRASNSRSPRVMKMRLVRAKKAAPINVAYVNQCLQTSMSPFQIDRSINSTPAFT